MLVVLLITGASFAAARTFSCSSALLGVAAETTCLDLFLLGPLAFSSSSTTSVIPTVNSWLTGVCSRGPCSNSTLQAVVTSITNGCSSDLAGVGLPTDLNTLTPAIQAAYPTVRQIACLKDTSLNALCVTELLNDIQSSTGTTLSVNNVVSLIMQVKSGANVNIPQNVTCSDCSKAAYTIVSNNFPTLLSSDQAVVQSKCGSSFTDGQMPSNIQGAAPSLSSLRGGAASPSTSSFDIGAAALIVYEAFNKFARRMGAYTFR